MARFYKTKIKEYPNGDKTLTVYKNAIFAKNEPISTPTFSTEKMMKTDDEIQVDKMRQIWKVKTKIKDYVLCNDFDCFWTLTFSEKRYDYDLAFDKMGKWLAKMRRKYGKFNYIFIPELHKDGAIHFHGVTGYFKGHLTFSGVMHKKAKVFNCDDWLFGFTTITRMRNKKKCATYVTKYFTKEMQNSIVGKGKKKYWLSMGLELPVVSYSEDDLSENLQALFENDVCSIFKL